MKRIAGLVLLIAFLPLAVTARKMVVATYNLRYDNKADIDNGNGWSRRLPHISRFISERQIDILGTQEGLSNMLDDLKRLQPGYEYVGVGRDDGQHAGEHSAIFYKTSRYELLAHGDFWLSTVTDKPNKGWDAALPRLCTWARLKEKKTGFAFYCFNLHMDHVGVIARRESAKLVLGTIKKMAGGLPVILMGDFNADQRDTTYAVLQQSGLLQDAFTIARERSGSEGTFNSFDTARHSDSRIDHLFLSKHLGVARYAIPIVAYTDELGVYRFASDHHPVVVSLRY
jgi:endonuclease/exonuclease/phosphatase family metal-dependent hydrolase